MNETQQYVTVTDRGPYQGQRLAVDHVGWHNPHHPPDALPDVYYLRTPNGKVLQYYHFEVDATGGETMTTETDARPSLVLPVGHVYQPGRRGGKQHITAGHAIGICGIVTMNVIGIQIASTPAETVCRKCVKAAQRKGLGVRYE